MFAVFESNESGHLFIPLRPTVYSCGVWYTLEKPVSLFTSVQDAIIYRDWVADRKRADCYVNVYEVEHKGNTLKQTRIIGYPHNKIHLNVILTKEIKICTKLK